MMHDLASGPLVPSMGRFNHPALRQYHEALGIRLDGKQVGLPGIYQSPRIPTGGMAYNIYLDAVTLRDCLRALTSISTIDDECLYAGILCMT
jgi:hypothetical protein